MPPNLKNLSYESNEPSFLRKLRAENGGVTSDRQERPIARPKRSKNTDDDDGPTFVLEESNNTLSKAEYEALIKAATGAKNDKTTDADTSVNNGPNGADTERGKAEGSDKKPAQQQTTEIGMTQKKRKLGKIVTADESHEATAEPKSGKRPKKKAKAVKLSFGDDETG
ncbi:MAG: hypothetical protein M1821_000173 [Bathelium mastoideum]|nr:MAG: hypothetical protein M1821_000173 [Bathelium mastoideum]KAI9687793.1 MAG: hypothetical protein M1822_001873 [Bathelium mastoideum]